MKKIFIFIALMFIVGCSSLKPNVKQQQKSNLADINVVNIDAKGADIQIVNISNNVIEIDWNGSSIDGEKIFVSGTGYENAKKSIPNSIIAPKESISKRICSSSQIYYGTEALSSWPAWRVSRLTVPAKVVIKIRNSLKSDYEIFILDTF